MDDETTYLGRKLSSAESDAAIKTIAARNKYLRSSRRAADARAAMAALIADHDFIESRVNAVMEDGLRQDPQQANMMVRAELCEAVSRLIRDGRRHRILRVSPPVERRVSIEWPFVEADIGHMFTDAQKKEIMRVVERHARIVEEPKP